MADFPNHEPLTRADLAGLSQAVLQATTAHRDEYQANLTQARAEIRSEAAQLALTLRNEMSHLRHDLLVRLEAAARRLDTLVDHRDQRILTVLVASQVAVVLILSVVLQLTR